MDDTPDKISIGIGQGRTRNLVKLPDGSYADVVAISAGAGLVTDSSGQHTFDLGSLASRLSYDTDGNQTAITYGPDPFGRYVQQTSQWVNGLLMGDSAWVIVDEGGNPAGGA